MTVRIGTRGSDLALWQANHVSDLLRSIGLEPEIHIIKTKGDQIQHLGFDKMEGKGFFTKEIEEALLTGKVDLAVHSHKDLETTQPRGLTIAAVPERSFVEDTLLIRKSCVDTSQVFDLKANAVIGTSSARRKAQLLHHLPSATIRDLRGNVPTRINKLREENYDAIVLAKAGMARLELDLSDFHVVDMDPTLFIPAPAQGALALQTRENDPVAEKISQLNHESKNYVAFERSVLRSLGGGCQIAFGAFCEQKEGGYVLYTMYQPDAASTASFQKWVGATGEEVVKQAVDNLS